MKKKLIISLIAFGLPLTAQAKDFMTYCPATYQTGKHGVVNIRSNHGLSIRNTTPVTQTYRVIFENAVYYGKSRQLPLDYSNKSIAVPNAHVEFDARVESGKEFHYGVAPISKDAYFEKDGRYKVHSTTTIKLNEYVVSSCIDYNVVEIY